jgi:hypothetical protein
MRYYKSVNLRLTPNGPFGDFVSYKLLIGLSSTFESVGIGRLSQNGFFENSGGAIQSPEQIVLS